MKSFIFDHYGYIVELEDHCFYFNGFDFSVENNLLSYKETEELNQYIILLCETLFNKKSYIVPNRNNQLITPYLNSTLSLVAVERFDINLNQIFMFHNYAFGQKILNLNEVKNRWIQKVEYMETKIIPSLKIDNYYYQLIMICVIHYIGLANNAINYLEDTIIDYGSKINMTSLAHKRLKLNSISLLNPFNLIIDSPLRDYCFLYMNEIISYKDFINCLSLYSFSIIDYSYLFSRMLFPSDFFDLVEELYEKRNDRTKDIEFYYNNINSHLKKIKKIHNYLVMNYGLRNIKWFENY